MLLTETPVYFVYIVVSFSGVAMLYLLWLAWQRPNQKRLLWRLICTILAVASLALMALRPQIKHSISSQEAILLTEATSPDSLKLLLSSYQTSPAIYVLDSTVLKKFSSQKVILLPDLAYLRRKYPQITHIHLLGAGLPEFELKLLDAVKITPHLSLPAEGLASIAWNEKINVGEPVQVWGNFRNTTNQPAKIILKGFEQILDSVEIAANDTIDFQLQTVPKSTGRYIYQLQTYSGTRLVQDEKIPVEIASVSPLRLLILESFPSFEVKFLKNWAAQGGNSVAVRASISKNKYRTEFLNLEKRNIHTLGSSVFQDFDIVITDAKSLENLSAIENKALHQAIWKQGLGLLIVGKDDTQANNKNSNKLLALFNIKPIVESKNIRSKPVWGGKMAEHAINIPSLAISYMPGTLPLVQEQSGRTLVSASQQGRGKVVFSIVTSTHIWSLEGHQEHFANYWTFLLNKLTTRKNDTESWQTDNYLPIAGNPVKFTITKKATQLPTGIIQDVPVFLQQNLFDRNKWEGTYWPDTSGWHAVSTKGNKLHWEYMYATTDWRNKQLQQKLEATQQYLALNSMQAKVTADSLIAQSNYTSIPLIYFFLVFVCSTGYLWLERKL